MNNSYLTGMKYCWITTVCQRLLLGVAVYSIRYAYCLVALWFVFVCDNSWQICVMHLPIFFRFASLALGQSYDCPSASEVTQKDMSKFLYYIVSYFFIAYCVISYFIIYLPRLQDRWRCVVYIGMFSFCLCWDNARGGGCNIIILWYKES